MLGGRGGGGGGGRGRGGRKRKHGRHGGGGGRTAAGGAPPRRDAPCAHALAALAAASGAEGAPPGLTTVDGSAGEGGGQVLRVASALAAVARRPLAVTAVRAKRSKPGLRPQHLQGLRLVARACGGALAGAEVGATAVGLVPGAAGAAAASAAAVPLQLVADTGTAGSVTMLAQAVLPVLLFTPCAATEQSSGADGGDAALADGRARREAKLVGGTDAAMAPPVDYMRRVLLPTLRGRFGMDCDAALERRGFFPKGGGVVRLSVAPLAAGAGLEAMRSLPHNTHTAKLEIVAFDAGMASGKGVAAQAVETARDEMVRILGSDCPTFTTRVEAPDAPANRSVSGGGAGVHIRVMTPGSASLGAAGAAEVIELRGGNPVKAAKEAASRAAAVLAAAGGADADEHLTDQLLIFMALAAGRSEMISASAPSLHATTAMDVCKQMLPACAFQTVALGDGRWHITCEGAGVKAAM